MTHPLESLSAFLANCAPSGMTADKWRTYQHGVIHTEVVTARGLHN
jgi:hypothetical protein